MNSTQKNLVTVLRRLEDHVKLYPDDAEVISEMLESMLDDLHQDDFFGTEGQWDPRGDFRDGKFTMGNVQGA